MENENKKINFAVFQSLADVQPDVDAIYRLSQQTPLHFKRPEPFDAASIHRGK